MPHFSELAAKNDIAACRRLCGAAMRYVALCTIPLALALAVFSHPIISMLFERGRFDSAAAVLVSQIQRGYLFAVPLYLIGVIPFRLFLAMGRVDVIMTVAVIGIVLSVLLNTLAVYYVGVLGVPYVNVIVYAVYTGYAIWRLKSLGPPPAFSRPQKAASD